jgi:O-acetyl-ADP-ribose deacetylase (regulator of RNase III)
MPLKIVRNDITKMQVDAIVNAANSSLRQGGGVCGAIFAAAGADKLQAECDRIGYCPVGGAVITGGYALPANYVIHAVGPVWQGGRHNEEALLSACYTNSLNLA